MKIEELLKPRFKVVADFPGNLFLVGTILTQDTEEPDDWVDAKQGLRSPVCRFYPGKYPANFKALEWWEERKKSELPKYVEINQPGGCSNGRIIPVEGWDKDGGRITYKSGGGTLSCYLKPATLEQYREQMDKDSGWAE